MFIAGVLLSLGFMQTAITAPIYADQISNSSQYFASDACPPDTASCTDLYSKYITPAVKLLTIVMGTIVVISIIIAGIQYASAGSDPQQVAAARKRIGNAVFGLVAYIFLAAFLNWVVPGGLV